MLQDSINKFKKPEKHLTPDQKRQLSEELNMVFIRTAEAAAEQLYGRICDNVALQLSQGKKEISGEVPCDTRYLKVEIHVQSPNTLCWDEFFKELDLYGLRVSGNKELKIPANGCITICEYPSYHEKISVSADEQTTIKFTIGEAWELLWEKLQAYARQDNISLTACLRLEKGESIANDYKLHPESYHTEGSIESETPIVLGTHEVSWPGGFRRVFEKATDFLASRYVRVGYRYSIVIKFYYQA